MIRRKFLELSSKSLLSVRAALSFVPNLSFGAQVGNESTDTPEQVLFPGTSPLFERGDLAGQMEDAIQKFLLNRTQEISREREQLWQRDYRSMQDYEKSVSFHREHFRRITGAVDTRVSPREPEVLASPLEPAELAQRPDY